MQFLLHSPAEKINNLVGVIQKLDFDDMDLFILLMPINLCKILAGVEQEHHCFFLMLKLISVQVQQLGRY